MKYQYQCPTKRGYTKFRLTRKQYRELIPNFKMSWGQKFLYYYNDREIIIHRYQAGWLVLVSFLLFPLFLLYYGIQGWSDLIDDYNGLLFQKKKGRFCPLTISNKNKVYNEVIKFIKS